MLRVVPPGMLTDIAVFTLVAMDPYWSNLQSVFDGWVKIAGSAVAVFLAVLVPVLTYRKETRLSAKAKEEATVSPNMLQPASSLYFDQRSVDDLIRMGHRLTEAVEASGNASNEVGDMLRRVAREICELKEVHEQLLKHLRLQVDPIARSKKPRPDQG